MEIFQKAIQERLKRDYAISVVPITDSTNKDARAMAEAGAPEGATLFARAQTAGRGRLGRSFFSPDGSGLYFSVVLRPKAADALKITIAAGVAVARAVKEVLGLELQIKWVNDLYYQNKKVCGILAEGLCAPQGGLTYCVLGIGINVAAPKEGFGALSSIAGALLEKADDALLGALGGAILEHFFALYEDLSQPAMIKEYQDRSFLQDKKILLARGDEKIPCIVTGISEEGALLARGLDGAAYAFSSGEVQILCFE